MGCNEIHEVSRKSAKNSMLSGTFAKRKSAYFLAEMEEKR
jgi:hypothetical protein